MRSTRIRRLGARPLDVPLKEPFGIAGGAQDLARNVLVTVTLEDGTEGLGEAAPLPAYNGETQADALAAIERARPVVEGADARAWRPIARALADRGATGSARCAIETAILDALARHQALPLTSFFGGAEDALVTDMTITTGPIERSRAAARTIAAAGFATIKVKVGAADLDEDLARLAAIQAEAPDASLVVDANASLSADDAIALVRGAEREGARIALFEQPVGAADVDGLARVRLNAGVRVAADESATSAAAVLRLVEARAVDVVNIKLMKCGVAEALDIASVARAAGLGLMIGGNVETRLAMSMSACFAAGLGGFAFVDLDTPMFLAEDPFEGGYAQTGARLDVSQIVAGHGVRRR